MAPWTGPEQERRTVEPTEQKQEAGQGLDLRTALITLRRRAWLIVLCFVVVTAAALGFSLAQQKQYSATAALLFRDPGFGQTLFGGADVQPTSDPTREAATNVNLASLRIVSQRTANALDHGLSATDVQSKMSVSAEGSSNVVSVTATDPDPRIAQKLANTYAAQFVEFRRDADRAKVANARRLVSKSYNRLSPTEQQSHQGRTLQNRMSQLETLQAVQTGNAEVVQDASTPTSPSSPKTKRNTILGAVIGLLLGIALAFLAERFDRRLRSVDDLEEAFELPMLGSIPDSKTLASANGVAAALPFTDREAFRMLRTRLRYFNVDREIKSVLVTSASPKDGKSTVAWYLASTAASSGTRTLLVEADLHQATLATYHKLDPIPGLAEILTHQVSLDDAIQPITVEDRSNGAADARKLDCLTAGATPPNPAELLDSHEMARVLVEFTEGYDLVVIDTPPVSLLADAIPLMQLVSGVIVVGQVGKTTRDEAAHLREQLRKLDAPVLGVAANRIRESRRYGRSYGYYYDRSTGDDTGVEVGARE